EYALIAEYAGLDVAHMHPHQFRRVFAVENLRDGVDMFTLMAVGGWRNESMLGRYARIGVQRDAVDRMRVRSLAGRIAAA
ncbi:MAG: tyrosine-type recombinase/integrase, partial [Candidatus Glassbacteria bacterium]|nr:tyrosine-type recombinase/integrase [Candidatus Glassbacteria bacterium]